MRVQPAKQPGDPIRMSVVVALVAVAVIGLGIFVLGLTGPLSPAVGLGVGGGLALVATMIYLADYSRRMNRR